MNFRDIDDLFKESFSHINQPKDHIKRINLAIYVLLFAFSLVSGIATYTGLSAVLEKGMMPLFLTVGIQGTILVALQIFVLPSLSRASKFISFSVYFWATLLSLCFGYSWFWGGSSQEDVVRSSFKMQVRGILKPVETSRDIVTEAALIAKDVSDISNRRWTTEKTRGNSCRDGAPPGDGLRARLREQDKQMFARFSVKLNLSSEKLNSIAKQARVLMDKFDPQDEEKFELNLDQAKDLRAGAIRALNQAPLLKFKQYAKKRLEIADQGFRELGETIFCKDPQLRTILSEILSLKKIVINSDEKTVVYRPGKRAAVLFSFEEFIVQPFVFVFQQIRNLLNFNYFVTPAMANKYDANYSNDASTNSSLNSDLFPKFMALIVDVSLFMLSMLQRTLYVSQSSRHHSKEE